MKRIAGFILYTLSLVYLNSCDKIEGNHFQPTAAIDTNYTFPTDTTPNVYRVLMEDYTGHTCGNCPTAARDLYNTIQPLYGDTLVTIGVHANFFAEPCPVPHSLPAGAPTGSYADDFRTPAGEAWYTFFQFYSNPLGMVNRVGYPNNEIITSTNWGTQIAGIIHTPQVKIRVHNIYNPSTRQLQTFSQTKFLNPLSSNYNLNVILSEDSIVAWQEDYEATNVNDSVYIERHVMRGSLNGNFGEQVNTSSPVNAGATFFKGYSTTLPANWNANHVHVVVFLFDAATYQILNVTEEPVTE